MKRKLLPVALLMSALLASSAAIISCKDDSDTAPEHGLRHNFGHHFWYDVWHNNLG